MIYSKCKEIAADVDKSGDQNVTPVRILQERTNMILLNGKPLDVTVFPDNTSQVWKLSDWLLKETNWFHITWEYTQEGDFLRIAQLKDLLDSYGHRSALRIKYLPYGRQDKEISTLLPLHFALSRNS